MVYKPKGRRFYVVKFHFEGKVIHKATKATSMKDALDIQAHIRSELAKGNWGILEAKLTPTVTEFLHRDFLPYIETKHATKPATLRYYRTGAASLESSDLARIRLEQLNDISTPDNMLLAIRTYLPPLSIVVSAPFAVLFISPSSGERSTGDPRLRWQRESGSATVC